MSTKHQLLFVQGAGAGTHDEWDDKLVASLQRELGPAYEIRYPRMPDEADPTYASWKAELGRQFAALDEGAILVGHSIGGTMLIHALAEQPQARSFGAVFLLAAPFLGEGGWSSDELKTPDDLGARLPEGVAVHIFHGSADETVPPSHAECYARVIPRARLHRLPGRDHQFNDELSQVAAVMRDPTTG